MFVGNKNFEVNSGQFFEKRLSLRERNMKLLIETVNCVTIKGNHLHNYNRHSHVDNALQRIPSA